MPPRRATPKEYKSLNSLKVPVKALREELFKLQKAGIEEYPLGDLLYDIKGIVNQKETNE